MFGKCSCQRGNTNRLVAKVEEGCGSVVCVDEVFLFSFVLRFESAACVGQGPIVAASQLTDKDRRRKKTSWTLILTRYFFAFDPLLLCACVRSTITAASCESATSFLISVLVLQQDITEGYVFTYGACAIACSTLQSALLFLLLHTSV